MKPRRRRIKVYATGAHRGALEQPRKCKNKRRKPISQLPGSAGSQQRAEDQAQIERPDVNQLALEDRSEEHTSELQSRLHLVCRLLLEKKKKSRHYTSV